MSTATIVDGLGEIVAIVTGSAATIALNTPAGCVAIAEHPPAPDAYRANGQWTARPARPTPDYTWNATTKQWRDERPLARVKLERWKAIQAAATADERATIAVGGRVFDADADAVAALSLAVQLGGIAQAAGESFSREWTLADDTTATLALAQLVVVLKAINDRSQAIRARATAARQSIQATLSFAEAGAVSLEP